MSTVKVAPVDKAQRRRLALELYIEALRALAPAASGEPVTLELDGVSVTLDRWACETARGSWGTDGGSEKPLGKEGAELLTHCLAYVVRSEVNVARMRAETESTGTGFYTLQAELMLDSALGPALLRELQAAVDDLVGRGAVELAKRLTGLCHQVRKAARGAQESIDASEQSRAARLTECLTDRPDTAAPTTAQLDAVARSLGDEHDLVRLRNRRRAVLEALRLPGLTEMLFVALAAVFVFYFAVELQPRMFADPVEPLDRSDFLSSAPIVDLVARPPSVYVTVDETAWSRLTESERSGVVEGIGSTLRTHDYTGAHLQTADRRPVARWLLDRGTSLLRSEQVPDVDQ